MKKNFLAVGIAITAMGISACGSSGGAATGTTAATAAQAQETATTAAETTEETTKDAAGAEAEEPEQVDDAAGSQESRAETDEGSGSQAGGAQKQGNTNSADAGRYVVQEYESNGHTVSKEMLAESGMDVSLELYEDGSGKLVLFGSDLDLTWEPGEITVYGTSKYTYEIDGEELLLDMQGVRYTLQREGEAAPDKDEGGESGGSARSGKEDAEEREEGQAESSGSRAGESESATSGKTGSAAETEEPAASMAENKAEAKKTDAPSGDGIVSEEQVQKAYVYLREILGQKAYDMSYEDVAAYFGVEGEFDKEEYVENVEQNRRYYKWVSDDDSTHFLYINFGEKDPVGEPGVYKITGYNTSGFSSTDAVESYLDILKAEALEADKAALSAMEMTDYEATIHPFGDQEDALLVKLQFPASGWTYKDSNGTGRVVNSDDPNAFGVGFIQLKVDQDIEKFDFYKDEFENYQEIEGRAIGGIEMQGRTYKSIGYDWTEYIGTLPDGRGISVGLVRVDSSEGSTGDFILNSIEFVTVP